MGSAQSKKQAGGSEIVEEMKEIIVFENNDDLSKSLADDIVELSAQAIKHKGSFTVALSGGSLPDILAKGILSKSDSIDFSKWYIFFADERHVSHDHADSNLLACEKAFLSKVPISKDHIYGNDFTMTVHESAKEYALRLVKVFSELNCMNGALPVFDLILLGMGPDGHTCSLFPNHSLLNEDKVLVASISDSPKPPPERITLTYPVLNAARNVYFVATGSSKADIIPLVTVSREKLEEMKATSLPAARVRPSKGVLKWYIDKAAAAKL